MDGAVRRAPLLRQRLRVAAGGDGDPRHVEDMGELLARRQQHHLHCAALRALRALRILRTRARAHGRRHRQADPAPRRQQHAHRELVEVVRRPLVRAHVRRVERRLPELHDERGEPLAQPLVLGAAPRDVRGDGVARHGQLVVAPMYADS